MSFFDKQYQVPKWFTNKQQNQQARRNFLKSAAGATAVAAISNVSFASAPKLSEAITNEPWLTLNAVLNHLLPSSGNGPGAQEINALTYLFNVVHQQPTSKEEKSFIKNGVTWLNDYSQKQTKQNFIELTLQQKESTLRDISRSQAGDNWINTLLGYIFEAMLAPPSYGGNPNGIGWQWLTHQPGFPLPEKGQRFYELPLNNTYVNNKRFAENKSTMIMMQKQKGLSS